MGRDKPLWAVAFALGMVAMSGSARAQYSGIGIEVTNTQAQNASLANFNALNVSGTPMVTFSASALDFSSYGNLSNTGNYSLDSTVLSFLNSLGKASGLTFSSGMASGASVNGILFEFTGNALFTSGQSYNVTHDDGVDFWVGGAEILNAPGPTGAVTSHYTYSGPTGIQHFTFVYGECCDGSAVFETTVVPANSIPEPASLLLVGGVLLAAGIAFRRRLAQKPR